MCGIFGVIGDYDVDDFRTLAILNEARGTDSFGVYDGHTIDKSLLKPRENLQLPNLLEKKSKFLMGHTRRASVGKVSEENAHPFQTGPVVGAHNGTVYNFDYLKTKHKDDIEMQMEVDSQIIFWGLWKKGFEIFKDITGLWAVSWYDHRAPNYFWVGSHNQDLAMARNENTIFYSSARKDLESLGLKSYELPMDTVAQIHIPSLVIREMKVETYVYSGYREPAGYNYGRTYHDHGKHDTIDWKRNSHLASKKSNGVTVDLASATPQERNIIPWTGNGYQNNMKKIK